MIIDDRLAFIADFARGKDVLDLGCVDHNAMQASKSDWLHGRIKEVASSLMGLDYAEEQVAALRDRGYNVVHGNVETVKLGRTFERIVAGELIEHLSNPGLFLQNMRDHLSPGGKILLTTPNPFCPKRFLEIIFRGRTLVNPEHVAWYCPTTLRTLFRRHDYSDVTVYFVNNSRAFLGIGKIPALIREWFTGNLMVVAQR